MDQANLVRIRDNQRRSRARRKEYLQDLEQRLRQYELQGVEASSQVQHAARKVAEENKKLRALLNQCGITNDNINELLRSFGSAIDSDTHDSTETLTEVQVLDRLITTRRSVSTGSNPQSSVTMSGTRGQAVEQETMPSLSPRHARRRSALDSTPSHAHAPTPLRSLGPELLYMQGTANPQSYGYHLHTNKPMLDVGSMDMAPLSQITSAHSKEKIPYPSRLINTNSNLFSSSSSFGTSTTSNSPTKPESDHLFHRTCQQATGALPMTDPSCLVTADMITVPTIDGAQEMDGRQIYTSESRGGHGHLLFDSTRG